MSRVAEKIKLNSFDNLFGNEISIVELPITSLISFNNHPFKVLDDDKMVDMVESIKENGVLSPGIVRASSEGKYELISGHRRKRACEIAGIEKMPVVIKELSDDEAILLMVDSNIQREEILPSEKAFSYKMKLEAMKRQGKRNDLTCSQFGNKLENKKSIEILAAETGKSKNQVHRYIRLTNLITSILDMVDNKKMALNVAYDISFLSEQEQNILFDYMKLLNVSPTLAQANKIREYSQNKKLTEDIIELILSEEKEKPKKVNLKAKTLSQYFPLSYTSEQMEDTIIKLLEEWAKNNNK